MKKNRIIFGMLLIFATLLGMPGCDNVDQADPKEFGAFIEPVPASPLDGELIAITGTTLELSWATSDADGDTPNADVYFGEEDDPELLVEGHTANSITVDVVEGHTYYWRVTLFDENGIQTIGATYSFTVAVNYNVDNYIGLYNCDEPGYAVYPCTLTKIDASTIENDNFWDSGWAVQYVFDNYGKITITPVSYLSGGVTYDITSVDGGFDNADQSWWVEYLVKNHATGATVDHNTHTFTRP